MKKKHILGILCISWAAFALPAAAQNGRQDTPANMGICDDLADATPGLQGLCNAMCEAQACEAELNPFTGEVQYGRSCGPSAPRLLANYNDLMDPVNDPPMPCVKVACPCWTQAELKRIGGHSNDACFGLEEQGFMFLQGGVADRGVGEFAVANNGSCASNEADFSGSRFSSGLGFEESATCLKTVVDECRARGIMP